MWGGGVCGEGLYALQVSEVGGEGVGGTFPPAAYGFRQGAGTERSTIWVSHSRPATQPPSTGSPLCLSLCLLVSLATNLAQNRRRAPGPLCRLSFCTSTSLSVLARLCQAQRLILGTGWLSVVWPHLLASLYLGLSAKLGH